MTKTEGTLSKETRKLRKVKKFLDEEEPIETKSIATAKTRTTRAKNSTTANNNNNSNTNSSQDDKTDILSTPNSPIPTTPPSSQLDDNNNNNNDMMDGLEEEDSMIKQVVEEEEMTHALKELNIKKKEDPGYDSMEEYNTDDLIEEVDGLPPIVFKQENNNNTTTNNSKDKKNINNNTGNNKRKRSIQKKNTKQKATSRRSKEKKPIVVKKNVFKVPTYDRERVQQLLDHYSTDTYWEFHPESSEYMIDQVNENNQLQAIHTLDHLQGPVLGMTLSDDGQLLATFCVLGHVSIWDVRQNFKLLRKLRDKDETQIDEFYCGLFKENYMLTAGKLKDRYRWSETDEDCHILPCPIKIFDLETDKVIGRLEGHSEEILCIKSLKFEDKNYYITTSQDGYIFKWHMENDWITLVDSQCMGDGVTCMAFTVSFLPNTGNKYFLGACDAHLKLYDFEQAQVMQTFENMYSSYCDCGKFIHWLDEMEYITNQKKYKEIDKENKEDVTEKNKSKGKGKGKAKEIDIKKGEKEEDEDTIVNIDEMDEDDHDQREYAWFISRGAEMCDIDDGVSSTPNTCTLHRLWYPKQSGDSFQLEEIKKYKHEDYHSNSWLVKIASNGRYLFAPTLYGQIFVFNILTGQVTSIIKEHQDMEVRDIIIHPYFPLLISCGDDGTARVYTWKE